MRNSKLKVKEIISQNSIRYLSDHLISDIIGNYKKEDLRIDNKQDISSDLNFFALLQVQI